MYRVGMSTCDMNMDKKSFMELAQNGIFDIEISKSDCKDYDGLDFRNIKKTAEESGINIWSFHLPFAPFDLLDISSAEKEKRDKAIDIQSELIKSCGSIGIDKFVIHPSGEPIEKEEREERLKFSRDSLSRLANAAEKFNAVICVEDLPRTCLGNCIDEMNFLTAEDERIKVCFDTNHIIVDKPEAVIRALKNKIVTLHVSDFDFVDEKHWVPGDGEINWNRVKAALEEIDYGGVWMYEATFQSRYAKLSISDFKENAKKILLG